MIIIAVLGVLGIIISIVLNFAGQATFNHEYFFRIKSAEKAYYMAVSTLPAVLKIFDADDAAYDCLNDYWARPLPLINTKEGKITVQIEDEDRKFNPNYMLKDEKPDKGRLEQFERLLHIIEADDNTANMAIDWIDKDSQLTLPGGIESAVNGINCKNSNMDSIEEFLYFINKKEDFYGKSVKDKYCMGLKDLLTVYSSGKVNINTAGREILMSLDPAITDEASSIILRRRKEKPFNNINELMDIPGINVDNLYKIQQLADVKSSYYRIRITVDLGGVAPSFTCVISREKGNLKPVLWKAE